MGRRNKYFKNTLTSFKSDNDKIIFEYNIPRLGKRIDTIILLRGIIFCLEFKVNKNKVIEEDIDQVLDYALDLKIFIV